MTRHPFASRHILIAGPSGAGADSIADGQLAGFLRHRRTILAELGLSFEHVRSNDLAEIARACDDAAGRVSAFVVRPDWHSDAAEVLRFFQGLRARHPSHWIVSIDPWDQCTGRFLGVLEHVDRLVKYQALKDRSDYERPMVGGTVLTDYMAGRGAYDPQTAPFLGSTVPPGSAERIVTGWYFSLSPRMHALMRLPRIWPMVPWRRSVDIACHVSLGIKGEQSYYAFHRREAIAALEPLRSEFRVRMSADFDSERTVSRKQYLHDCRRARIMVSPFGWGEVSSRDYEAAAFGCLLVRPRVDHVQVLPDIFVPGETYVPVAWDCSDLADKCRHYLTHPQEAQRIVDNARRACRAYFEQRQYLDVIREMLGMSHRQPRAADDAAAVEALAEPHAGSPAAPA